MYRCPKCQRADTLAVTVIAWAELIQDDDNIETDIHGDNCPNHDHEIGEFAYCKACDNYGKLETFESPADAVANGE